MKKVLVLSASPMNEQRLRLDEEARELRNRLNSVKDPKVNVNIENRWAVRSSDIQVEIVEYEPEILHFSGHGNRGILCFEDKLGNAMDVEAEALAELISLVPSIKCLVLSACYSEDVAIECSEYTDVVIGCSDSIDDDACIAFSYSFYSALARGEGFQQAYRFGKNEVRLNCGAGEADKYVMKAK